MNIVLSLPYSLITEYQKSQFCIQYSIIPDSALNHSILFQISDVSNVEHTSDFGAFPGVGYFMETNESLVNGSEIHKWACHVYQLLLKHLPAMVSNYDLVFFNMLCI